MLRFLIKYSFLVPLVSLNFLSGCQLFESHEISKITNQTNDYDLCFPLEYMKLFNLPDKVRYQYLKDVQIEIDKRELDCKSRFEAYIISNVEASNFKGIEETDLDKINKKIFDEMNKCGPGDRDVVIHCK